MRDSMHLLEFIRLCKNIIPVNINLLIEITDL